MGLETTGGSRQRGMLATIRPDAAEGRNPCPVLLAVTPQVRISRSPGPFPLALGLQLQLHICPDALQSLILTKELLNSKTPLHQGQGEGI